MTWGEWGCFTGIEYKEKVFFSLLYSPHSGKKDPIESFGYRLVDFFGFFYDPYKNWERHSKKVAVSVVCVQPKKLHFMMKSFMSSTHHVYYKYSIVDNNKNTWHGKLERILLSAYISCSTKNIDCLTSTNINARICRIPENKLCHPSNQLTNYNWTQQFTMY